MNTMFPKVAAYIANLDPIIAKIPAKRRGQLSKIADYIHKQREAGRSADLLFICTHNSRRSHFCQIWCSVAASHFGYSNVRCYSGGTEATAFNPRAVKAIERAGFRVENKPAENPEYKVLFDDEVKPITCYSKRFDAPDNPQKDFAAIMTCSDADQNCPVVPGASFRISIPYVDPKQSDDTPKETEIYDQRCRQIAAEMFFMMGQL